MPVGSHRLQLTRDGFVAQDQDVQVQAGSTSSIVVGHWVATARSAAEAKPRDDHGLYFRVALAGPFSGGSDGMTQQCADKNTLAQASCSPRNPLGGSIGLRVGYRFNWIAPELFGLGNFAVSYVRAQFDDATVSGADPFYGPARREDYIFFRYGWAAGAGVRATSPTSPIAATGAVGVGVFGESGRYARSTTSVNKVRTAPLTGKYGVNPATGMAYDYGTPGLDIVSGTQFRIGPMLGFQFGY